MFIRNTAEQTDRQTDQNSERKNRTTLCSNVIHKR